MKKLFVFLAAIGMLFACTPENNPSNGDNNDKGGNTQPTVVELTGIALTEHEITLEKGGNKILEVKFTPENATDKTLTWVSSNPSIVTVTDGIVVGVAPGATEVIVKSGNLTDKCQVTVAVSAASVSLDQTELTFLMPGETATLKATVLPEDTTDELEWTSSDEAIVTVKDGEVSAVAVGDAIITAKAGEKTATCSVVVFMAVDLGLSVRWASSNLRESGLCENAEDYGDYYAWGETETKSDYSWGTYKWANGSEEKLTKYCPADKTDYWDGEGEPDDKTVLDLEDDDVASVKLGGNWRMPTDAEWTELRNNCVWAWTTQNSVNGYKVTGPNGNSIFLPAAGYRYDSDLYAGSCGCYWSSSLYTDFPFNAFDVYFDSGNVFRLNLNRCDGQSVRPVTE